LPTQGDKVRAEKQKGHRSANTPTHEMTTTHTLTHLHSKQKGKVWGQGWGWGTGSGSGARTLKRCSKLDLGQLREIPETPLPSAPAPAKC